ncbi:MAG: NUDIX hydrolase [Planctomycetes bacterium]|nr:NUDIX hydrolase [Planctomycetota bacterium]
MPTDAPQIEARARMLEWIARHPHDAHLRTCLPGHLTASALILNHERTHALLTHHKKLDRWLQLGGHCDGDANLARVALREALEESGIADLRIDPRVLDLDIHTIPSRGSEREHLHLDVRFQILAPSGAKPVLSDESHALAWVSIGELGGLKSDESVLRLYRLAFDHVARP